MCWIEEIKKEWQIKVFFQTFVIFQKHILEYWEMHEWVCGYFRQYPTFKFPFLFSACGIACYIFLRVGFCVIFSECEILCYIFPRVEFCAIFFRVWNFVLYFSACGNFMIYFRVVFFRMCSFLYFIWFFISCCIILTLPSLNFPFPLV